jgi:L,D-transpeptidase YcbB
MNPTTRIVVSPLAAAALAALLMAGCGPRHAAPPPSVPHPRLHVRREIEQLLDAGDPGLAAADTGATHAAWPALAAYYHHHHARALWSDADRLRPAAAQLVAAVAHMDRLGLDPGDYGAGTLATLQARAADGDTATAWERPRHLARFDVAATCACLMIARDLRHGRIAGDTLDADWTRHDAPGYWNDVLERFAHDDPDSVFATLEPAHDGYRRLAAALARYRAVAATGGWREIPPGPPIVRGARGERVARLVRRLAATGELAGPVRDTVMDDALVRAVGDFQSRSGIPRSGTVGEATRAVLNVPVEARIRTLALNLERWRWLPDSLGHRRVEVNIPAFRLDLFRADTIVRTLRVVVGKRQSPTPVFSDALTYLELNPSWTVPPSVVFKEIIPAMKGKVEYLARNRMIVVPLAGARGDTLDPKLVPWKKVTLDSFPYLVVQKAGPDNPLGSIKLMCPNEYDVYLHDTPRREKFGDAVRDYSHGCVRVSGAVELADSLLDAAAPDSLRLDSLIATGQWRRIRLPHAVPVHFLYWTAWADSAGAVHWRQDLYGVDARLDEALRHHDVPPFALNPSVALSPYWVAAQELARTKEEARRKKAGK